MKKILFVCHGNICRSVAAMFIAQELAKKAGKSEEYQFDSCATSLEEIGNDIYPPMKRALERFHIPFTHHEARQITKEDYLDYDVILYMDKNNQRNLLKIIDDTDHKCFLLSSYVHEGGEVEDPWYTGRYDKVILQLMNYIQKIIQ